MIDTISQKNSGVLIKPKCKCSDLSFYIIGALTLFIGCTLLFSGLIIMIMSNNTKSTISQIAYLSVGSALLAISLCVWIAKCVNARKILKKLANQTGEDRHLNDSDIIIDTPFDL